VRRIPLASGVLPEWYNENPPAQSRIPMTEDIAVRARQYPANPYEAFTAWNREFLRRQVCAGVTDYGLDVLKDEYVFTPAQALDGLLDSTAPVTFFGHTHHQGGFSYQDSQLEVLQIRPRPNEPFAALRVELPRRYLLNPGSIGQPRDGDPRAAFAIADLEHQVIEFWRVPYDISVVQKRMRAAHLPEPLVQRLTVGR